MGFNLAMPKNSQLFEILRIQFLEFDGFGMKMLYDVILL